MKIYHPGDRNRSPGFLLSAAERHDGLSDPFHQYRKNRVVRATTPGYETVVRAQPVRECRAQPLRSDRHSPAWTKLTGEAISTGRAITMNARTTVDGHQMSIRTWALLALLGLIWGGSFFFARVAVAHVPPFTLVVLRLGLAA